VIGPILHLPYGLKKCFITGWPTAPPEDLASELAKQNGCNRGVRLDHYASLDLDSPAAKALLDQWKRDGTLPRTVGWKTASGAERHLFKRPTGLSGPLTIGVLKFQLRTGNGMQDVIPPSYVKDPEKGIDGHYEWLPGQDPESIEVADLPDTILAYFRTHGEGEVFTPKDKPTKAPTASNNGNRVDIEAYLAHCGVEVVKVKPYGDGTMYCLRECIFDPTHAPNDAAIIQWEDGKLTYQCFHDTCKGRTWTEARQIISGDAKLTQFMAGGTQDYD
jgi:hypothetical protein